ncbi:MAG: PRC-barrel domain-containing protein [Selenomonadaceae bacterium]|nr:PRC-barrel domain-containing protein [Selenomonadaceae bacterium]
MKKSIEILGLPIISITEGRELGVSKSLLIDAKNGTVAAITIEDDDWYRGVKLIPYEAIIAIGEDAVTITHSENILNLEEAGDYERLLVENIRVIGTKAITKTGRIQGKVTEVFIGVGGRIEKCEITKPDGTIDAVNAEQISIFGKQVTVIDVDEEKKNSLTEQPAFEPAFQAYSEEPEPEVWTPPVQVEEQKEIEPPSVDLPKQEEEVQPTPELTLPPQEEPETTPETQAALEETMTPEPVKETIEQPVVEEPPVVEEVPVVEEPPVVEEKVSAEDKKIATMTQQAEDLKAALQKARANKQAEQKPMTSQKKQVEKAVDERRRRVLLGKHATKTITAESGTVVVEAGAEVTEEVLQRARLSNKFIELSMNVQ